MKKLITISAIAMSGLMFNAANAQIRIGLGIRLPHIVIVPRPVVVVKAEAPVYQEPIVSDNDDCDFYYLPDVGAYYSVAEQCYYYQDGDSWVSAAYLPGVYRDYDWRYAARRFEIREARPYLHNNIYRSRYQGFDRDLARNHDHFAAGIDYHYNRDAYNNGQRFDNRDNNNQRYGDNNHNYGNNKQSNQTRGKGNRDNQQRIAQNNQGYNGHDRGKKDRF